MPKAARPVACRDKWRIRWIDALGQRQSDVYESYKEAKRHLRRRQVEADEIKRGLRNAPPAEKTFGDLASSSGRPRRWLTALATLCALAARAHPALADEPEPEPVRSPTADWDLFVRAAASQSVITFGSDYDVSVADPKSGAFGRALTTVHRQGVGLGYEAAAGLVYRHFLSFGVDVGQTWYRAPAHPPLLNQIGVAVDDAIPAFHTGLFFEVLIPRSLYVGVGAGAGRATETIQTVTAQPRSVVSSGLEVNARLGCRRRIASDLHLDTSLRVSGLNVQGQIICPICAPFLPDVMSAVSAGVVLGLSWH